MTKEEAIEFGKRILCIAHPQKDASAYEFTQMAISALENHDEFMKRSYSQGKADAQEPCDDAISREDAIKSLQKVACYSAAIRARMIGAIEDLPSVTQKSETETWNGMHGQITAPKGTFKKIFDDAESEDKE